MLSKLIIPAILYVNCFSQEFSWAKAYGGQGKGDDDLSSVSIDPSGNVFAAGKISDSNKFEDTVVVHKGIGAFFITRVDALGHVKWFEYSKMKGYGSAGAISVGHDKTGNVFALGWYSLSPTGEEFNVKGTSVSKVGVTGSDLDIFLLKYKPTGELEWLRKAGSDGTDDPLSMFVDSTGDVFISGKNEGAYTFSIGTRSYSPPNDETFLAKFSSAGTFQWVIRVAGPSVKGIKAISTDRAGNIYATGYLTGAISFYSSSNILDTTIQTNGNIEVFIAKYSKDSQFRWVRTSRAIQSLQTSSSGTGILVDEAQNIFSSGYFTPYAGQLVMGNDTLKSSEPLGNQPFLIKCDSLGNIQWSRNVGPPLSRYATSSLIKRDTKNIYYSTSGGIHIINSNGNLLNSSPVGGITDFVVTNSGNIVVGGTFKNEIKLGSIPLKSEGAQDQFGNTKWTTYLAEMKAPSLAIQGKINDPKFRIVISGDKFILPQEGSGQMKVRIQDINGRNVESHLIRGPTGNQFSLRKFGKGIYYLSVESSGFLNSAKILIL